MIVTDGDEVDILVVEDNDSERESILKGLDDSIPDIRIVGVNDGLEALDFLYARGAWSHRAGLDPPKLIVTDLIMPGSGACSVLVEIRSTVPKDALTLVPVVVFSSSSESKDINESYRCGANSYIMKPIKFSDFKLVVERIGQYWMMHNNVAV